MAKVLQQCRLIVWDECTMAHKKSLEAFDRTLQDLRKNQNRFGSAVLLLAGDFRQTLPVIPRSTPANDQSGETFSKQLLDISSGKIPVDSSSGYITIPTNFCHFMKSKTELIEKVFPNIAQNYKDHVWMSDRVILAAKNIDANEMHFQIQNKITGELVTYKSIDSVTNQDGIVNYPTELLNLLELPGLPPHNLN